MELFELAKRLLENDIDCHIYGRVYSQNINNKHFLELGIDGNNYTCEEITEEQYYIIRNLELESHNRKSLKNKEKIIKELTAKLENL